MNKIAARGLNENQMSEALALARSGLQNPAAWDKHLRLAAASLMLSSLYGERPVGVAFNVVNDTLLMDPARERARPTPPFHQHLQ